MMWILPWTFDSDNYIYVYMSDEWFSIFKRRKHKDSGVFSPLRCLPLEIQESGRGEPELIFHCHFSRFLINRRVNYRLTFCSWQLKFSCFKLSYCWKVQTERGCWSWSFIFQIAFRIQFDLFFACFVQILLSRAFDLFHSQSAMFKLAKTRISSFHFNCLQRANGTASSGVK